MSEYTNATPLAVTDFLERINPLTGTPFTPAEAQRKVHELVFGHDFKTDAAGKPVETGKGSAAQPTHQHFEALAKEAERQALMGKGLTPEAIGAAVAAAIPQNTGLTPEMIAAAVTAALAGQPSPLSAKRRPARKAKPPANPAAAQPGV